MERIRAMCTKFDVWDGDKTLDAACESQVCFRINNFAATARDILSMVVCVTVSLKSIRRFELVLVEPSIG